MRLEKYIGDLLYRYQCVTVPGFGSFLSRYQSARVHTTTDAFYPPSKVISFNEQISDDDGLLTKHIAAVEKTSFEEASAKLSNALKAWRTQLKDEGQLHLEGIGEMWLSEENKILFQPSYQVNYLSSAFGLGSFVSPSIVRETLKEEVAALEEKAPIRFTPESRSERSYLKYAAIILLALSAGAVGFRVNEQYQTEQRQIVIEAAQQQVEERIQEATFFDTKPLELPVVTLNLNKVNTQYHIVAGAYRMEENAAKRAEELKAKGYEARLIGVNRYGLHQVAYASFPEAEQALEFLRTVKQKESKDAWLLVEK